MKQPNTFKAINRRQTGFTLIELMLSIVIGLVILAAVMGIFVSMISSDNANLKTIRLNQELRAAMSLMTRDIRRAGADRNAVTDASGTPPSNPFSSTSTANTSGIATQIPTPLAAGTTTLTYSYDAANDGTTELYGFRWNNTAGTERIEQCVGSTNVAAGCGAWQPVTDDSLIKITNLTFQDATGTPLVEAGITIREITITLSGQLRASGMTGSYQSESMINSTLTETVRIRNDEF